jgi:cell division protein FtsL
MAFKFIQAFKQAPWRVQMQKIGLVMVGLVSFALIAGLYLSISATTYATGVKVQRLEATRETLQRENADLEAQNATQLSATRMKERSNEIGFAAPDPQAFVYIVIQNYAGRQMKVPIPKVNLDTKRFLIKPEYKQSLWEYLFQGVLTVGQNSGLPSQ